LNSIAPLLLPFLRPLRAGLLLLLLPQGRQTDTRDLDDLETDTGNITLGLALTTETGQEDFVVLVDEVQTTVIGDCELFSLVSDFVSRISETTSNPKSSC